MFQQGDMNLIVAILQKEDGDGSNARHDAITCNSVERAIRGFCCPSKNVLEKLQICTKAHLYERLKFFQDLHDYWYWIGHWEVPNEEETEPVDWGEFVHNTLTIQEKKVSFKILTSCTCCKRHQDLHGINKQNYTHKRRCSCSCRHMARWLKRSLENDEIQLCYGFVTPNDVSCLRSRDYIFW